MKLFGSRKGTAVEAPPVSGDGVSGEPPVTESDLLEMSFLDHLEEFRWAVIRRFVGVGVAIVVCAFFSKFIIDSVLLGPAKSDFFMYRLFGVNAENLDLLNRTITGQFFAHIGTIAAVGIVVGSPFIVYNIWKFIEPGLYPNEKAGMKFSTVFATFFFVSGILFGYLIITPLALQFFANYQISDVIANQFDITRYFSMVTFWAFGTGILFELPVVIYFLSKLGIVTPDILRKYRRVAVVGVLVAGALFTPPDPVSQILVATPLFLLYEGSIFISSFVSRRREAELREALS
ncbi:MAG: twin-arginine translocase subunit TatC [Bacteroidota bacterium]